MTTQKYKHLPTYKNYCLGILQYENKQPEPFWKIVKDEVLGTESKHKTNLQ